MKIHHPAVSKKKLTHTRFFKYLHSAMLFQVPRTGRDDSKVCASVSRPKSKGMLLLRYQRQRHEEDGGHRPVSAHDMRRKINDHELKGESRRAATRGTLICIFVCGSLLFSLGLAILLTGLLAPIPRKDPTPFLVIGPTCIVLGILVLLLSVEIIIKLRKISASSGIDESDTPVMKRAQRQSWGGNSEIDPEEAKQAIPKSIPVIIHPATPLQSLDPTALPGNVIQHK